MTETKNITAIIYDGSVKSLKSSLSLKRADKLNNQVSGVSLQESAKALKKNVWQHCFY